MNTFRFGCHLALPGALLFLPAILVGSSLPPGWTLSPASVGGISTTVANLAPTDGNNFAFVDTTGGVDMSFTKVVGSTTGSVLSSPMFTVTAGQILRLSLNFLTNDGEEFADFAYAHLISASQPALVLYTANTTGPDDRAVPALGGPGDVSPGVVLSPGTANFDGQFTGLLNGIPYGPQKFPDGAGGSTGWVTASVQLSRSGEYQLMFVVANVADAGLESALAVDNVRIDASTLESFEQVAAPVPEPATLLIVGLSLSSFLLVNRPSQRPVTLAAPRFPSGSSA